MTMPKLHLPYYLRNDSRIEDDAEFETESYALYTAYTELANRQSVLRLNPALPEEHRASIVVTLEKWMTVHSSVIVPCLDVLHDPGETFIVLEIDYTDAIPVPIILSNVFPKWSEDQKAEFLKMFLWYSLNAVRTLVNNQIVYGAINPYDFLYINGRISLYPGGY